MNESERFWSKVDRQSSGCWIWNGSMFNTGYGQFKTGPPVRKPVRAHRWAYAEKIGVSIHNLDVEVVMHTCDTPRCVNPMHLVGGTHATNHADRASKGRNADKRGEKHHMRKLTDSDVRWLRANYEELGRSTVAKILGVSVNTVYDAKIRRTWNHVT